MVNELPRKINLGTLRRKSVPKGRSIKSGDNKMYSVNLRDKMISVINEVNNNVAEREELVECIAIALLTKKNIFILGDTGQAKSMAINEFRKRITGAKQFERLLSKQTDEEALFGRIDLKSLIDGNPRMITTGKIPDSHIVFLDELFKCNEGVLNSLLTALNERTYTNESETVSIPAISFMAASNEIPNFNNPDEKNLRPLYDRLDLKVVTQYIENRATRQRMLMRKQTKADGQINATLTLDELYAMQRAVASVIVPTEINELMDDILCELRRLGIHVSDRKFLNYYPIAQAKAWLSRHRAVEATDLISTKNYFWTKVDEIPIIQKVLEQFCLSPLQEVLKKITLMAEESYADFEANADINPDMVLNKLRSELLKLYCELIKVDSDKPDIGSKTAIRRVIIDLEEMSEKAHNEYGVTYMPLSEFQKML